MTTVFCVTLTALLWIGLSVALTAVVVACNFLLAAEARLRAQTGSQAAGPEGLST